MVLVTKKKIYPPHRCCPHTEGWMYTFPHSLTHQKIAWHGRGMVIISLSLDGNLGDGWRTSIGNL